MNILFCCEGFIVDGVASYNLYMSSALSRIGHNVAVVGRWGGFKGFQGRLRDHGVKVLQRLSVTVSNPAMIRDGIGFKPDLIITDSRRAFPLAKKIKEQTGAELVMVFHDPPQPDGKRGRGLDMLRAASDYWLTAEGPIFEELQKLKADIPVLCLQRPITAMVTPSPVPQREPFRIVCLGRLSSWKSPAIQYLVWNAAELHRHIPELEIYVVGGGRRILSFQWAAMRANNKVGKKFVHILGTRVDPSPWFQKATVVCAGATSAIEAILSNRPVVAVSGVWMGPVTRENLQSGLDCHFAERYGEGYGEGNTGQEVVFLGQHPEIIGKCLKDVYADWQQDCMERQAEDLRNTLFPQFDSERIAQAFCSFVAEHRQRSGR